MEHWLDSTARRLAAGGVSRRAALRRLGAGTVVGVLAIVGIRGRRAAAQVVADRRCLINAQPDTPLGCPTGETCCPTVADQGVCCPGGTTCPPPGDVTGPVCLPIVPGGQPGPTGGGR
jgi:hypothetical protein